ncbi:MAG: hypothetical protein J7L93_01360 [Thermoplasmata archaeon]|nr:hypothetical protein [Thermoplasmata archaeon]
MRKMRKAVFLLVALMLLMFSLPAQEPASAGIIPWGPWSNFWWNVQVEPIGDSTATVEPLDQYAFHFKFWNGGVVNKPGRIPLRYYLKITNISGEGWTAHVNPTFIPLGQDESYNATVYVTASVKPSYIANITCEIAMHVKMTDFIKYNNITFQVRSQPYRWLAVSVPNPVVDGKQEHIYTVPINITNNGNYDDEYLISVPYAPSHWLYALSEQKVHLFPGESATVNLTFYIPHERLYIQYENYLMQVKVQSVNDPGYYVTKPVVVSLSGFHMTVGQLAASASVIPSLILLAALGIAFLRSKNTCRRIPKPWKDEREKAYLSKLPRKDYAREKKMMKEEWKSAFYFCREEEERRRKLKQLMESKARKQRALEGKIIGAWKKAWEMPHSEWKRQTEELRKEYGAWKRKLLSKWRTANETIRRANREMGCQIPLIPKPEMPPLKAIPEPGKPPKPRIPGYEIDTHHLRLIGPDEILLERIMMPLKRGRGIAGMESEKIAKMGEANRKKMGMAFSAIEKRLDEEIARANSKIRVEREKAARSRKVREQKQRAEEEKRRLREKIAADEKRKKERMAKDREKLKREFWESEKKK